MAITIYHNPRCSKSRQTLELLSGKGLALSIVEYLDSPPDAAALKSILSKLNLEPRQLMRKKEAIFGELDLSNPDLSSDQLIAAMIEHPILIERPIVVYGERAIIGRPPENINILFDHGNGK